MNKQFRFVAPSLRTRVAAVGLRTRVAAVGGAIALAGGSAHAALPPAVTDAITEAGTDLVTAGTAVIVAIAAFWGLRLVGKKLGLWS